MKEVTANPNLIAACGLYCGACKAYLKDRCPGCRDNARATWCKVKVCCAERGYASCADCTEFADPNDCRKYNNLIARVFGVVMNSNRRACVLKLREVGRDEYAAFMAAAKRQTFPRRGA